MPQQVGLFPQTERTLLRASDARAVYYPAILSPRECALHFEELLAIRDWRATQMWMYDQMVDVPRLVAWYGVGDAFPRAVEAIRQRVEGHLGARFNSAGLNLYRDGNDSVAWHSDRNENLVDDPLVAIVSLGATREMYVRTIGVPRSTVRCDLEAGSLLVMAGHAQERFEHTVPKSRRPLGARISVVLRQKRA